MAAIPTNASHTPKKHSTPRKQTPVKTPRKTPNKMNTPKKVSPRHARHSRKARSRHCSGHIVKEHHILKTKMVSETPRHKQVAMALRKQERQQSETLQDVVVVEESPEKDLLVKSADLNASSLLNGSQKVKCKVQGKSILARRGSFYSEASRTLQKHRELAKRIAGHQPVIPLHPEMKLKLKTPVRKRGDFLLSQIRKSSEKKIENAGESQDLKKSTPDKTGNCTQVTNSTTAVTPRRATKKALFLSPVRTPTRTKTPTPRSSTQEETSCHTSLTPRKTPKKTGTPSSVKRAVFNKLATTPVKTYQETPVSCSTKVSNVCISETPSKLTNPDFVSPAKQTEFERLTWVSTTPQKAGSGISLEQSSFADTPSKNTRSRTEVGQYDELGDKNGASRCQTDEGLSDIHNKESNALTEAVKPAKLKVERQCATDSEQLTELDTTNQSKTSKVHRKQSERRAASNSTKSRKKLDSSSGVESENDTTPMKGQLSIKTFLQHTPPQETLLSSASPFTPPPIRVQTTPDTFDKWHRRKSRHGLHSPAAVKTKAASSIFNTQPCQAKETGSKRQKSRRSISNGPSPSHANLGNYGEGNVIAKDDDSETAEKGCKDNSMLSQNQNENSSLSFHDYMVFLSPSHRKTRKAAQEGKMSDDESVIHFKAAEDQGYSLFDPESAIQYNINVAKQVLKSSNEISEGTTIEKEVCRKDIQEAEEDSLLSNKEFAEKRRVLKHHSRSFDSQSSKESFNTQGWLPERVSRGHVKDTVVEPHQTKRSPPVLAGDICRDVSSDDSLKENKVLSRKRTWTSPNEMRTSKRLRTNTQSSHFDTEDSSDSISMESGDEFLNENETNSTFSYSSHKRAVMVQNTTNSDLLLDGVEAVGSPVHQRIYSLRKGRLRSFSSDVCHIVSGSSHHCDELNSNVENSISKPYIQSSKGKSVSDVADLQTASPQGSEKQSSPKYSPVSAIGLLGLMNSPIINTSNVGAKLEVNKVGESEQRPRSRRTLNMKSANN
ncbi:uncharacterized protein LOC112042380 [Lingula anatina]|uniref:Uncharacterized protein LOC112042380 n=1 Tax=Lingula anatina TaxID=7574 RepID=A0A2R2MQU7_LINAN|nr:uncharacterized protein LOC112042380 [Lingula anatina]|eukprot:XP_023932629.1 uncharacterized protein LOC112042380 [Lingula anatina]